MASFDRNRQRAVARTRANDPLMREVRWRLFSRDELPARLRRLERLEDAAHSNGRATPKIEPEAG
jgi:hypothetical protein